MLHSYICTFFFTNLLSHPCVLLLTLVFVSAPTFQFLKAAKSGLSPARNTNLRTHTDQAREKKIMRAKVVQAQKDISSRHKG